MIVIGIIFGLALSAGVAFMIGAIILRKSNDFGDSTAEITTYTGYDPVNVDVAGQVKDSDNDLFSMNRLF